MAITPWVRLTFFFVALLLELFWVILRFCVHLTLQARIGLIVLLIINVLFALLFVWLTLIFINRSLLIYFRINVILLIVVNRLIIVRLLVHIMVDRHVLSVGARLFTLLVEVLILAVVFVLLLLLFDFFININLFSVVINIVLISYTLLLQHLVIFSHADVTVLHVPTDSHLWLGVGAGHFLLEILARHSLTVEVLVILMILLISVRLHLLLIVENIENQF